MKIVRLWVVLFLAGGMITAWAGDFKPMLQPNSFKPLVKSGPQATDIAQWFPTNMDVVISNKVFYFFRSENEYHTLQLRFNPPELIQGGFIKLWHDYKPYTFRIHSITTNYMVLGVQGSLNLKKVPVNILDQFE